jgi:hypothetical protein
MANDQARGMALRADDENVDARGEATRKGSSKEQEGATINDRGGNGYSENLVPMRLRASARTLGAGGNWAWSDSGRSYDWMDWHVLSTAFQWR